MNYLPSLSQWQQARNRPSLRSSAMATLITLLLAMAYISLGTGAVDVAPDTIESLLLDRVLGDFGYTSTLDYDDRFVMRDQSLILDIRLPRVILVAMVGATLALAGTALQGIFRNPLAAPGLIGVSSGAAVGAITSVMAGWTFGTWVDDISGITGERLMQSMIAFIAGLATTLLVYRLAYRQRHTSGSTILLIGLAINTMASAYIGLATFIAGQAEVGDITFWTLGSAAGTFWSDVYLMLPMVIAGGIGFPFLANRINLLALGESEARYLGIPVEQLRLFTMAGSAILIGAGVSMVGIIGFVGLVVPHVMRFLFGPDHRTLFPMSMIGGALFLLLADLLARIATPPTEVPLGVITALVGGPFFLGLILVYRDGID